MERNQVEKRYTWNTDDIFPSDEEWEKAFDEAEKSIDFGAYAGKLGDEQSDDKFKRLHLTDLPLSHQPHDDEQDDVDDRRADHNEYHTKSIFYFSESMLISLLFFAEVL